jgi:excisionase family DNA binding protein
MQMHGCVQFLLERERPYEGALVRVEEYCFDALPLIAADSTLLSCGWMAEDRVPLFVRLPREQAAALDRMVESTGRRKQHLVSDLLADQLAVGHLEIGDPIGAEEVLTLEEAAALLRLPADVVRARASAGDLPGRSFGTEWRFARSALVAWLAHGERAPGPAEPEAHGDG